MKASNSYLIRGLSKVTIVAVFTVAFATATVAFAGYTCPKCMGTGKIWRGFGFSSCGYCGGDGRCTGNQGVHIQMPNLHFARFDIVNATSDGKVLHVRVYRRESPGKDGAKDYHLEILPGGKMTISGHGIGGSVYVDISYFDYQTAQPRKRIHVQDNRAYVVTGRRGNMSWRDYGPRSRN